MQANLLYPGAEAELAQSTSYPNVDEEVLLVHSRNVGLLVLNKNEILCEM
jgi:hypothetical protein